MEKLNLTGLAKAFSVSQTTCRNWVNRGIPHEKTDKGLLFKLSDCIKWHQERFLKTGASDKLSESRAIREHFKAKLTELEFLERDGQLVPLEEMRKLFFEIARLTRDSLLCIPARISPLLAAETDVHKINMMMDAEIKQALENLVTEKFSGKWFSKKEDKKLCRN